MSRVRCQLSGVMYHMSHFFFLQSVGDSWCRVCYQRGLPRLVLIIIIIIIRQEVFILHISE